MPCSDVPPVKELPALEKICEKECPPVDVEKVSADYEKAILARSTDPERSWHSDVFALACQDHLLSVDVDIAEA